MTHFFAIPGMTCSGCERTVTQVLSGIEGVSSVKTELQPYSRVEITMTKHLETDVMNAELAKVAKGKYVLLPDNNGVRTEVRLKDSTSNDSPIHAVAE